jgi:hypothetical protein
MNRHPLLLALLLATLAAVALWFVFGADDAATPRPSLPEQEPPAPEVELAAGAEREAPVVATRVKPPESSRSIALTYSPHPGEGSLPMLVGRVTDAVDGTPLPFFVTALAPTAEGDVAKLAESSDYRRPWGNSVGAFTYRNVEPGRYALLVRCEGYRDYLLSDFTIPIDVPRLDIQLQRGAWIEALVVDAEEQEGEGGIEVQIVPLTLDDATAFAPQVLLRTTDAHGKALFTGIEPGTYEIRLVNHALSAAPVQQIYVGRDVGFPVRFVIDPLNDVVVRVTASRGDALKGVHVRMWSDDQTGVFRAETDLDGEAYFEHVPQGLYTLKTWRHGYLREDRQVAFGTSRGEHEVEVVLDEDPLAEEGGTEANPTLEQLDRIKAGERPSEVFRRRKP